MGATIEQAVEVDGDKLMQFVFRAVDEVGATLNAALVVMGDKLGLYRALAGTGGLSPAELAERTGTAERYVREWLNAQAAGGYVTYDPDSGRYTLPPEQTVALTDADSPAYLPGFFQIALGSVLDSPRITEKARSGDGFGWHEHVHDVHEGCERFFRPGLQRPPGRRVAARARGRGRRSSSAAGWWPTSAAATAPRRSSWPRLSRTRRFVGSDYHDGSIETARASGRRRPASPTAFSSKSRPQRRTVAPTTTW